MRLSDLKVGEKGVIAGFDDSDLSLKLLEMGCLPGTEIQLSGKAPLGDPICVNVSGYTLAMRMQEAHKIFLKNHYQQQPE
ncbi:MAG: FeoA family protein [Cytophagaceae bacterium]|nr:FeoA family protein [Cytophagaceae bacterium]